MVFFHDTMVYCRCPILGVVPCMTFICMICVYIPGTCCTYERFLCFAAHLSDNFASVCFCLFFVPTVLDLYFFAEHLRPRRTARQTTHSPKTRDSRYGTPSFPHVFHGLLYMHFTLVLLLLLPPTLYSTVFFFIRCCAGCEAFLFHGHLLDTLALVFVPLLPSATNRVFVR